jgi:transposase
MLNYETYCKIRDHLGRQSLTPAQTAQALGLDVRTVSKWADTPQYQPRASTTPRVGKLDAYKGQIVRWLDTHPYSAQQIYQRLREIGYDGGITIVKDYVQLIRPRPTQAFLKLHFEPAEAAQVDWGEYGTIAVGSTHRRLVGDNYLGRVDGLRREATYTSLSKIPTSKPDCASARPTSLPMPLMPPRTSATFPSKFMA